MPATVLQPGYTRATAISASASPLAVRPDAILVNATATFTATLEGVSVVITSAPVGVLPISPTHVTAIASGTITALFADR